MSGEGSARVRPVRPTDPVQLGPYRILGRLGEGGMGLVYLAESPGSRRVALKVIRDDLADEEFRRRFKSEVARARQVPPFCTAEVIDADTEHDPPYLVVEYVDGPSLSAVVADKGPLTPANQQGLAVGVAVALTAIHGAGVIHRDLKPSNVLLAPGSPKVIDFGIARATAGTDFETQTNQMVGTVSYMAPERFDGKAVTPAADIFAWGALVAYAGTGRTPFAADTPAATAMRIMTGQPDLEGLTGPLREMVEWTLAKNPADRPEARDLLDHLLAGGSRSPARPASFVQQPEVLAAAGFAGLGGSAAPPSGPTVVVPTVHAPAPTDPAAAATFAHGPVGPPEPATVRMTPVPAAPTVPVYRPPGPPPRPPVGPPPGPPPGPPTGTPPGPPSSRRGLRVAITALALAVLLLSASVAAFLTGVLPVNRPAAGASTPSTPPATVATTPPASTPTATPSPTPTSTPPGVAPWLTPESKLLWRENLKAPNKWVETSFPRYDASCTFDGGLRAQLGDPKAGSYKCTGLKDNLANFSTVVDVVLHSEGSCAGVWFRSTANAGYVFRICRDEVRLYVHNEEGFKELTSDYPDALPVGRKVRVAVMGDGETMRLFVGGEMVLEHFDGRYTSGRVVLGVVPFSPQAEAPYRVTFTDVVVYRAPNTTG